jgi:oligopeptidase B
LDRGFIYAIAHIRGGEYLGREWYEDGKMLFKKNTFFDFIDAGKFLIKENYTSSNICMQWAEVQEDYWWEQ